MTNPAASAAAYYASLCEPSTASESGRRTLIAIQEVWRLLEFIFMDESESDPAQKVTQGALKWIAWISREEGRQTVLRRPVTRNSSIDLFRALRDQRFPDAFRILKESGAPNDAGILESFLSNSSHAIRKVAQSAARSGQTFGESEIASVLLGYLAGDERLLAESADRSNVVDYLFVKLHCLLPSLPGLREISSLAIDSFEDTLSPFMGVACMIIGGEFERAIGFLEELLLGAANARSSSVRPPPLFQSREVQDMLADPDSLTAFLSFAVYLSAFFNETGIHAESTPDAFVEELLKNWFQRMKSDVAVGSNAAFLAEHIALIQSSDKRSEVWAGCFLELANHYEGFSASRSLCHELVVRQCDLSFIKATINKFLNGSVDLLLSSDYDRPTGVVDNALGVVTHVAFGLVSHNE